MKKVTLLFLMLFAAIGFAQETTLKGNGVDNPTHYNPYQKVKTGVLTESQQAAEANMENLGENKPFFINEQQNQPKTITSEMKSAEGAVSRALGTNNPTFINEVENRSTFPATQELRQNVVRPLERSLFGTFGLSSSGVEGRVSNNPPAGTASMIGTSHRPEASVVITHSVTQNILPGNSVTCNSGNIPDENSFFRDFNLAADFGITDEFNVTSAEFGVEDSGGPTNLTINIYSTSTVFPGGYPGSATLRGTSSYVSGVADAGTVVSVPITATIPAGEIMIYELKINAGAIYLWFPGSNADGQTGVSWLMSDACGISTPTNLADIGFPGQHMVMNIVGEEGTGGGGSFPDPYCAVDYGTVEPISLVEVAGISNRSSEVIDGSPAHEDFTAIVGNMEEGQSYSIALEGNTNGGFTCSFTVFIDWNQDGILDNASERYEIGTISGSSGTDGQQATNTITVPAGVAEGPTRMRVLKRYGSTYSVDSCTGTSWGQAEDYTIDVTAAGGGGGGVCANPVIEVNQDVDDTCMAFIAPGIAQSYIPLETESAGAGIKFTDPSTGLNVAISLWDGLPNAAGNMLTNGTTDTDGTNWADVLWNDVVSVTVGNTYYLVIEGDPTLPCLAGSTNNPYAGGMTYANGFSPFPTFDYTFRTFSCDSGGGGGGTACSQNNPENGFENGFTTSKDGAQIIATDINVPADTNFSLEKMTVNIWMGPGETLNSADITFYDNASDLPGTVRNAYPAVVPVSQTVIGNNFGWDISEVVFEIAPEMLPGAEGSASRYWVSLYIDVSSGSGFIGSTSATIEGVNSAFSSDTGATWNVNAGYDTVYLFEGTCEDIGGGGGCTPDSLQTLYAGGNGGSAGGAVYFDITVGASDIDVQSFDINTEESGTFTMDVYVFEGTYVGNQANPATWGAAVAIGSGSGAGIGVPSTATLDAPVTMSAGTTYAVALVLDASHAHTYTNGDGTNQNFSNGDITIDLGSASNIPFVDPIFDPRIWNGGVGYCVDGGGGGTGGPCATTAPSNAFENGKSFTKNLGRIVANDITVVDGEDMLLESITFTAFIGSVGDGVNADNVDVFIYEDNGSGAPGALLTSQTSMVPTSQVIIGGNFGYDAWSIELDITDVNLEGQTGSDTTYWVGLSLEPTDGSNTFWEYSTAGVVGLAQAYDDGTGFIVEAGIEGVYSFDGTCSPIGGGGTSDPCSETSPSNAFENGKSFTKNLGRITAADITIAADEDMLLETINFTSFIGSVGSGVNASNVDVFIYADSGAGSPGALLTSQLSLVPASQTVIGNNFGYDAWSIDLDIADYNLPGQAGVPTTYWIGLSLEPTDGSNTFWEYTSLAVVGYGLGYDDGTGFIMEPTNEVVYTFAGTCSTAGGGGGITNDECSGAIAISCGDSVTGTTVGATIDSGAPTCGPSITSPGVWYSFDDNSGVAGDITVSLCDGTTTFDTKLSIYSGTCSALVCVDGNDDSCGLQSEVTFASNGNTKYYILVHSFAGETGTFTLDITCDIIGISENAFEGFSYYPNPTSDILNLKSIDNIESVSLYNLLGQRVIDNQVNATTSKVDISGLSTGTYLMKVTVNGQIGTYKVLKQ